MEAPIPFPTDRDCPFHPPSKLRKSGPLTRVRFSDGHEGWLVTSHELAHTILRDARFAHVPGGSPTLQDGRAVVLRDAVLNDPAFSADVRAVIERYHSDGRLTDAFRDPQVVLALHERPPTRLPFFNADPPEHTRLRRIIGGYFTVRRVAEHRARTEQIVTDRLDAMEEAGPPVDLFAAFAHPIPSLVLCALFGVPEADRETFERLTAVAFSPGYSLDEVFEADAEFRAFGRALVRQKRAQPDDGLITALVETGELTDEELAAMAVIVVRAAHDTTATALAFSVLSLLEDRDQWNKLTEDPGSSGRMLEELLRFTTVVTNADLRTALEDVEFAGTKINAFDTVVVSLAAADRDPQAFSDPDRLDVSREASRHLAFGHGIHQCPGQHLARLEMEVALTGLAERFPGLHLSVPSEDLPWRVGENPVFGPAEVPVAW